MVLNTTNKNALVDELGKRPANWIGAEVGIYTEPTTYNGKPTRGLRLRVLNKPAATPPPKASPAPKPAATEGAPWPDQLDDPGAEVNKPYELHRSRCSSYLSKTCHGWCF
jgi:hypothetical protein